MTTLHLQTARTAAYPDLETVSGSSSVPFHFGPANSCRVLVFQGFNHKRQATTVRTSAFFDSKLTETQRKLEKMMMIYWCVPSRIFIFDKTPEKRVRKIFPSSLMRASLFSSLLIELNMTLSSDIVPFVQLASMVAEKTEHFRVYFASQTISLTAKSIYGNNSACPTRNGDNCCGRFTSDLNGFCWLRRGSNRLHPRR